MWNLFSITQIQSGLCVCLFANTIKMDDTSLNSICVFHPFLLDVWAISFLQPVSGRRHNASLMSSIFIYGLICRELATVGLYAALNASQSFHRTNCSHRIVENAASQQ